MTRVTRNVEYLAGLFDGEGSFSIQVGLRPGVNGVGAWFNPSMSVNLYYGSEVLQHFVETFGGRIYPYQKSGRPCGRRWHLGRRVDVTIAAVKIAPLLEIKREVASNFIRALGLFPADGARWTPDLAVEVAEIALTLNPASARKSKKTLDYLDRIRAEMRPETFTSSP